MLDDDSLAGAILGRIRGQSAIGAIAPVAEELSQRFDSMSDEYLREGARRDWLGD